MTVSNYLINLIRATVRNEMPIENPDDISWRDLFELAVLHQVDELAFFSVEKLKNKPEGEDRKLWIERHERSEVIDVLQREEAKLIIEEASKKQIGILPLKGTVFKSLYPNTLFREMGDLDFLIEPGKIDEIQSDGDHWLSPKTDLGHRRSWGEGVILLLTWEWPMESSEYT